LLAKTHFIVVYIAHPQAGNARGWADNFALFSPFSFGIWIYIRHKMGIIGRIKPYQLK
jgi:hypothetical protein